MIIDQIIKHPGSSASANDDHKILSTASEAVPKSLKCREKPGPLCIHPREFIKEYEAEQRSQARAEEKAAKEKAAREAAASAPVQAQPKKKKLTYKEQKELEKLEKDLEDLANEKAELEASLNSGTLPFDQLQQASERIGQIIADTDEKELRLLELYELQ